MSIDDDIRVAWEAYHGPIQELDGYIPETPPAYARGYRDGRAAAYAQLDDETKEGLAFWCAIKDQMSKTQEDDCQTVAPAVITAMKAHAALLRIELKDALMIGYGARMNWPESAKALL